MSPTPEKDDPDVCYSTSAFPGEPTYRCSIAGWHPHKLHDDGEHHRWFDAVPDLPIEAWQADVLERVEAMGSAAQRAADAAVKAARSAARGFVTTGHQNTDRALQQQADFLALPSYEQLDELTRAIQEDVREMAAQTFVPPIVIPYDDMSNATVGDLTAELRRLDHKIAMVRAIGDRGLALAAIRDHRERVRKARAKQAKLDAWYDVAAAPRRWSVGADPYGPLPPRPVSFAEVLTAAAMEEGEKVAKKKIMDLPKVEYTFRPGTNTLVPVDPEAAKVDHVMTRNGEIYGIARVSKEPIPDGTTIRTQKTEDLRLGPFGGPGWDDLMAEQRESFSEEHARRQAELGEVRTTSSTGGEKGMKPARFDLIPVMPLTRLAELYGAGAAKYESNQWRKGFEISKSYAALQRHVTAFWGGEDNDPELGTPHLASVIWHAMAMMQFLEDFPQHDDRYKKEA